jgi:hypothetical protein
VFVFLSGSASRLESVGSFWRWKEECVNEAESLVESHEFGRSRLTGSGRERVGEVKDRGRRVQPHNSGANCNSACNAAGAALCLGQVFDTTATRRVFIDIGWFTVAVSRSEGFYYILFGVGLCAHMHARPSPVPQDCSAAETGRRNCCTQKICSLGLVRV